MDRPNFYFEAFEHRKPPKPLVYSAIIEGIYQFLAVLSIVIGGWYTSWRWTDSLNYDALWFSLPLLVAETGSYIGLWLFTFNLWRWEDPPIPAFPQGINDCIARPFPQDRPILLDIFYPTYNENPELVRLSLLDGKKIRCPETVEISLHVLDDGKRETMAAVAKEEGVNYITRDTNEGYKAGNLKNAMKRTTGDFILICDADTRVFPEIIEEMLPYFRDPNMAWVQSPQWFYDLPAGKSIAEWCGEKGGKFFEFIGKIVEAILGPIRIGEDPFANEPKMFYDIILRRRNYANAAFCCGAGSLHRRESVMQVALKNYSGKINSRLKKSEKKILKLTKEKNINSTLQNFLRRNFMKLEDFTPYKFHVSEDIYTSIKLHADQRNWRSVQHPKVLSKMLSPQDLGTWAVQRFKYAGGTLDIFKNDNPLREKGLNWRQKLLYLSTYWSYLGGVWNLIFLISPILFLLTGISPVEAYSIELFKRLLPFLLINELAFMFGTMGLPSFSSKSSYISFFHINLKALWTVFRGKEIKFKITSKSREKGNFLKLTIPHCIIMALSFISIMYANISFWYFELPTFNMAAVVFNSFWAAYNACCLSGIVAAALWSPPLQTRTESGVEWKNGKKI